MRQRATPSPSSHSSTVVVLCMLTKTLEVGQITRGTVVIHLYHRTPLRLVSVAPSQTHTHTHTRTPKNAINYPGRFDTSAQKAKQVKVSSAGSSLTRKHCKHTTRGIHMTVCTCVDLLGRRECLAVFWELHRLVGVVFVPPQDGRSALRRDLSYNIQPFATAKQGENGPQHTQKC